MITDGVAITPSSIPNPMSISLITTGYRIPRKPDYAASLISSVRHHEPGTEIILVDCNSKPPYKPSADYRLVKVKPPFNIGRMINAGLQAATGEWLIYANDDVLCYRKFADQVTGLDKQALWCETIVEKRIKRPGKGWDYYPTAYGWLMIIHRTLYEQLGAFDESNPSGGLDIEYSLRAIDAGIPIGQVKVPFKHIHDHRRG